MATEVLCTEKRAINSRKLFAPELLHQQVSKNYDDPKYYANLGICTQCGWECCKSCGCYFSTDDFKEISFEFLKEELEKGYISIAYVSGDILERKCGLYILRVRNQNAPVVDLGAINRAPCILLGEDGCKLNYANRPTGGKLRIPSNRVKGLLQIRQCKFEDYTLKMCGYEWAPHQKVLEKLVHYFNRKKVECQK